MGAGHGARYRRRVLQALGLVQVKHFYGPRRVLRAEYRYDRDSDGLIDGHRANLFSGIAPASEWTQYKTGFTMPAGTVRARFVHFIARNGWLQTDDYPLTEEDAPAGFRKPMISLTFDDGSQGFWNYARDPLKAKVFKTTQYVPTGGLTSTPRDTFMMTPDEITTLAQE